VYDAARWSVSFEQVCRAVVPSAGLSDIEAGRAASPPFLCAALRAGDLVRGSGASGIFVPRGTAAHDQLVFSITPPEKATARARLVDGLLSVVTRGIAMWTMIAARLERVTRAAALFENAIGRSAQLDGLFTRLITTKSGNAVLLNKYERVLNGSVRVEQWFYLGVTGAARPTDVTEKEDTGDFAKDDGDAGDWREEVAEDGAIAGGDAGLSASEDEDDAGDGDGGDGADDKA
jgi:hypothetical protein